MIDALGRVLFAWLHLPIQYISTGMEHNVCKTEEVQAPGKLHSLQQTWRCLSITTSWTLFLVLLPNSCFSSYRAEVNKVSFCMLAPALLTPDYPVMHVYSTNNISREKNAILSESIKFRAIIYLITLRMGWTVHSECFRKLGNSFRSRFIYLMIKSSDGLL